MGSPAGSRHVERHLAGKEGAGAGAGGGSVPTRYDWAYLHTQHRFWNQTPGEGLGCLLPGVAQGARRQASVGILTNPGLSVDVLEFSPVSERSPPCNCNSLGGRL